MKGIKQLVLAVILSIAIIAGVSFVYSAGVWTNPSVSPVGRNVDTPLNIGVDPQSKEGYLGIGINNEPSTALEIGGTMWVKELFETFYNAYLATNANATVGIGKNFPPVTDGIKLDVAGKINGDELCIIGSDPLCISAWPEEEITNVTTGEGLIKGGTISDITITADPSKIQRKVINGCSTNQAIQTIDQNGNVTCSPSRNQIGCRLDTNAGAGLYRIGGPCYVTIVGSEIEKPCLITQCKSDLTWEPFRLGSDSECALMNFCQLVP